MKTIKRQVPCPSCYGTGTRTDPFLKKTVNCGSCKGTGKQETIVIARSEKCPPTCEYCPHVSSCQNVAVFVTKWDDCSKEVRDRFIASTITSITPIEPAIDRVLYSAITLITPIKLAIDRVLYCEYHIRIEASSGKVEFYESSIGGSLPVDNPTQTGQKKYPEELLTLFAALGRRFRNVG